MNLNEGIKALLLAQEEFVNATRAMFESIQEMQAENTSLKSEVEALKAENGELKKEIKTLKEGYESKVSPAEYIENLKVLYAKESECLRAEILGLKKQLGLKDAEIRTLLGMVKFSERIIKQECKKEINYDVTTENWDIASGKDETVTLQVEIDKDGPNINFEPTIRENQTVEKMYICPKVNDCQKHRPEIYHRCSHKEKHEPDPYCFNEHADYDKYCTLCVPVEQEKTPKVEKMVTCKYFDAVFCERCEVHHGKHNELDACKQHFCERLNIWIFCE